MRKGNCASEHEGACTLGSYCSRGVAFEIEMARKQERDKLKAEVERLDKLAQGYYNEASEGWSKFRRTELQVGACRSVLADAVRGHCTICGMGGDASKQNHHEDCEARKLITESRIDEVQSDDINDGLGMS